MNTETWLGTSENSKTREQLFLHRLCYDITLAAARRQNVLAILTVDIDRYGWDLALDDGDNHIRLQLKTVHKNATTANWKVRKRLLRPEHGLQEELGFENSPEGTGLGGGFLLIEYNHTTDETIKVKYHYASALTLTALDRRLTGTTAQQTQARKVLGRLRKGSGTESLNLTNPSSHRSHPTAYSPSWDSTAPHSTTRDPSPGTSSGGNHPPTNQQPSRTRA